MSLIKKANGENYKFASEELITQFVELCKAADTEDCDIIEMLQSMENEKIARTNQSFEQA